MSHPTSLIFIVHSLITENIISMPILFLVFVLVPIIEIALFIQAGDWFGLAPTLMMIVVTAVIGVSLLRRQGLSTLYKAQEKMNHGEIPAMEMVEGIMLAVAGALLITPGFFTDTVGFLLLIPAIRHYLFNRTIRNRVQFQNQGMHSPFDEQPFKPSHHENRTIEGEYKETDE